MKDYLNDLYARLGGQMKLGLGRTLEFMAWLHHPELTFPAIHVAGTNGKGSVVALCEAILHHGGYLTGRFTSPHLVHFNERIRINGNPVSENRIEALITQWHPWLDSHDISFLKSPRALPFTFSGKTLLMPQSWKPVWADAWIQPMSSNPGLPLSHP